MNKPILFIDFDGTICFDKYWRDLPKNEYKLIQNFLFIENKHIVESWMIGKYSSEEVNKIISDSLKLSYKMIWDTFVEDCKTMSVDMDILESILKLRETYQTVLITGNMDCFSRFTVPALNLNLYFEHIINSADTGSLKDENEGSIFINYAKKLGTDISKCILIDDSEKICNLFNMLGGTPFNVNTEKNIKSYLREL